MAASNHQETGKVMRRQSVMRLEHIKLHSCWLCRSKLSTASGLQSAKPEPQSYSDKELNSESANDLSELGSRPTASQTARWNPAGPTP